MLYLVLAHPQDETALRVGAALRRRHGRSQVRILSAEALALAPVYWHRLGRHPSTGRFFVETKITLPDGDVLDSSQPGVIFNRLQLLYPPHFTAAKPEDRDFAAQELNALWMSWLYSLAGSGWRIINPVSQHGLAPSSIGPGPGRLEWLAMAAHAGLRVCELSTAGGSWTTGAGFLDADSRSRTADGGNGLIHILAAGDQVQLLDHQSVPALTATIEKDRIIANERPAIANLQDLSGCPLLELQFHLNQEQLVLVGVEPFPHFSGPGAVAKIVELLSRSI